MSEAFVSFLSFFHIKTIPLYNVGGMVFPFPKPFFRDISFMPTIFLNTKILRFPVWISRALRDSVLCRLF